MLIYRPESPKFKWPIPKPVEAKESPEKVLSEPDHDADVEGEIEGDDSVTFTLGMYSRWTFK